MMQEIQRSKGKFILIYGKTGVGKSTTCIATLPQPILDIFVEDKDPYSSIEALESMEGDSKAIDIKFIKPENDSELIENLDYILEQIKRGEFPYHALLFDTASMWMNIKIADDMLTEFKDASKEEIKRPLVNEMRISQDMYGALARRMIRITKAFQRISQQGVVVVWIAQAMDTPKWDVQLSCAPNFIGQEYNKQYEQFFDAIGLVRSRTNKEGKEVYPPVISFKSPDNTFTAKWSGRHLKNYTALFDFAKILRIGR